MAVASSTEASSAAGDDEKEKKERILPIYSVASEQCVETEYLT